MVEQMRSLCRNLENDPNIITANLDDWGYYGNFSLLIQPACADRFTTNRLKGLFNRMLRTMPAHLRAVIPPDTVYELRRDYALHRTVRKAVGYSSPYWKFDIDFMNYNLETNTFISSGDVA